MILNLADGVMPFTATWLMTILKSFIQWIAALIGAWLGRLLTSRD